MIEDQYHIFSYYPKSAERNFELYEIGMNAGCEHSSIRHSSNSMEYVLFTEGWIFCAWANRSIFRDGGCTRNNASLSHCYINNVIGYTRSADFLICFLYSEQ